MICADYTDLFRRDSASAVRAVLPTVCLAMAVTESVLGIVEVVE